MARQRSRSRTRPSEFAYVDSRGDGHLKVADAADVEAAIDEFAETEFEGTVARERARLRILVEAERHHVPVPRGAVIDRPTPGTEPDPDREPDGDDDAADHGSARRSRSTRHGR